MPKPNVNNGQLKVLISAVVVLTLVACATGSSVVTGKKRTPVAATQVKLYLEPPSSFEVIGLVNASSDVGWTDQGSMDYAIEELKKQAGKLGANGVLILASGETTSTIINRSGTGNVYAIPVTAKTLQGKAIFVLKN